MTYHVLAILALILAGSSSDLIFGLIMLALGLVLAHRSFNSAIHD